MLNGTILNGGGVGCKRTDTLCEVCGKFVSYPHLLKIKSLNYTVCQSFDCQRIMDQKSLLSPQLFSAQLEFNKKLIRQRNEKSKQRKQYLQGLNAKESKENKQAFKQALSKYSELSEVDVEFVLIPSGNDEHVALTAERVEKYAAHLKCIINEACEYVSATEVAHDEHHDAYVRRQKLEQKLERHPQLSVISDKLCAMCKGGCCACGKEHAYHSVFSMRRYMDENPQQSAGEIIECFLSAIATHVIADSCINHTVNGCALPRSMRSDICNAYYCDSLKKYQDKMFAKDRPQPVIAVQRSSTYWNRFETDVNNEIVQVALIDNQLAVD